MKKIILISIVVLSILIIVIIGILMYLKPQSDLNKNIIDEYSLVPDENIINVENENIFFTVQQCIEDYLNYIVDENFEAVYAVLNKNYIKVNSITINNVKEKVINVNSEKEFTARNMRQLETNLDVTTFFVSGKIRNKVSIRENEQMANNEEIDIDIIVNLDLYNNTFSIIPQKELANIKVETEIELNKEFYNEIYMANVTDSNMIQAYMKEYINEVLYNPQEAYEMLDEEYRTKRFGSLDKYIEYITENKEMIKTAGLTKYQVNLQQDYKQYVGIDQNKNYYIFRQKGIMQYKVLLDTYTIDLPEYIEKYVKANNKQKVALCIQRFINAINDKNYTFAYSLLSSGFKDNYFQTQERFEIYVNQNLLGKETVTYKVYSNEKELHTYSINLADSEESSNIVAKTFIVKLGEGTNFELSFNV